MAKKLGFWVLVFVLAVLPLDSICLSVVLPWFINTGSWFILYLGYALFIVAVVLHVWLVGKAVTSISQTKEK